MRQRAVSLIELLVVVSIIAITLGLTGWYVVRFRAGNALRVGSQIVVAALHQARTLTITEQVSHGVALRQGQSHLVIFRRPDNTTRVVVSEEYRLPRDVVISSTRGLVQDNHPLISAATVPFQVTGSAISGSIWLANAQGEIFTVTVVAPTGRARIYPYNHGDSD